MKVSAANDQHVVGREIDLLPDQCAFCRLAPDAPTPHWATLGAFASITRTPSELSVVCPSGQVPSGTLASGPWRALRLRGPLDAKLVGVMLSVAAPLAAVGVSIMPIATFDTDYILVRETQLDQALAALRSAGHLVHDITTLEELA